MRNTYNNFYHFKKKLLSMLLLTFFCSTVRSGWDPNSGYSYKQMNNSRRTTQYNGAGFVIVHHNAR